MSKKLLIISMAVLVMSTSLVGCDKLKGGKPDTQASVDSEELSPEELGDLDVEFEEEEFTEPSLDGEEVGIGSEESSDSEQVTEPAPTEPKEEPKQEKEPKKKDKITVGDIKIPGGL